jgi:hypothetical protein
MEFRWIPPAFGEARASALLAPGPRAVLPDQEAHSGQVHVVHAVWKWNVVSLALGQRLAEKRGVEQQAMIR